MNDMYAESNQDSSDQHLMQKIRLGDHISFKILFERCWSELYIYAFNILKVSGVCEDIVQDVFVDFWQKAKGRNILNSRAYLYKSVKFQILNHIRDNKIHQKHLDHLQVFNSIQNLEDEMNCKELDELLLQAIQKLPERCREVFELSRIYFLSNKEIAGKLNISIQTVKNQISTALIHLRKALESSFLLIFLFLN